MRTYYPYYGGDGKYTVERWRGKFPGEFFCWRVSSASAARLRRVARYVPFTLMYRECV